MYLVTLLQPKQHSSYRYSNVEVTRDNIEHFSNKEWSYILYYYYYYFKLALKFCYFANFIVSAADIVFTSKFPFFVDNTLGILFSYHISVASTDINEMLALARETCRTLERLCIIAI